MKTADFINDSINLVRGYELNTSMLSNGFGGDGLYLITVFAFAVAIIAGIVILVLRGSSDFIGRDLGKGACR